MVIRSTRYRATWVRPPQFHSIEHLEHPSTPRTTTLVIEYPNVTQTNPTLITAIESLTDNKLHFKNIHEAQT
jgi:hypothetical protein